MPKWVSEILGGVTAKSAILIVFNTDCCLKVISWQYSVQKSKMKIDKFGAFGAAERQPVRFVQSGLQQLSNSQFAFHFV